MHLPKQYNRILWVALAAAVLLLAVGAVLITQALAADYDNLYAVNVTTGECGGENVRYLGLKYEDDQGRVHVEYVFPWMDGLTDSLRLAQDAESSNTKERLQILSSLGMRLDIFDCKPLQPYSTNTYFFQPAFQVKTVLGLEVYCVDQGTWDVQSLQIYKVNTLHGLHMEGYASHSYQVRFSGVLIGTMAERGAEGNGGESFNWAGSNRYTISDGLGADVRLDVTGKGQSFTTPDAEYVLALRFADVYEGGLEFLVQAYDQKKPVSEMGLPEGLFLELQLLDHRGDLRKVDIPLVKSSLAWLVENGMGNTAVSGIAQQGETLAVPLHLPGVTNVMGVTLYNGTSIEGKMGLPAATGEKAYITSAALYHREDCTIMRPTWDNAANAPQFSFSQAPLYYHTSATYQGEEMPANTPYYVSMRPYEPGAVLDRVDAAERYLINLKADSTELSKTPEDVYLQLQYVDIYGGSKESPKISVRSAVRDYYGYWPASQEDYAYQYGMFSEAGIELTVDLRDVDYFTGLRVSTAATDRDWQMSNFTISRVQTLGSRKATWVSGGNAVSNRVFARENDAYLIFNMNKTVLVQPGDDYTMDFVSGSVLDAPDVNWKDMEYSMTFEESCSNLGFTKGRQTYNVEVKVADTGNGLDGNGDSGSKNKFYFQLQFEEGSSGYVLANQQLGGDGFRSGYSESISITTNQDYGELVAVKIIPDDISEDSDPYDKLNIDNISVTKASDGIVSREWQISNVGWIGIDFREEGASGSIIGQQGRTEGEMARVFRVNARSYRVNVLFCITTGEYESSTGALFGGTGKFDGTVWGQLEYYTNAGERKIMRFDLVQAMYEYANQTYTGSNPTGAEAASYMFRANHTDRFVLSLQDAAQLGRLTLQATSPSGGNWNIADVSASLITSDGTLQINAMDEYQRTSTTEPLCTDVVERSPSYTVLVPAGVTNSQIVDFTQNAIEVDSVEMTWTSAVSREPASSQDELNVFIYPAANARGDFTMRVAARFTNAYGNTFQTSSQDIPRNTDASGRPVYYVLGLTAPKMSTLNDLTMKANSLDVVDAYIEYAVVQRVRSGVVIDTYYLNCGGNNAEMAFTAYPSDNSKEAQGYQEVTITLGEDTKEANLVPEVRDLAVALKYTTTTDGGIQSYHSKYVFLSDFGVTSVAPGDVIRLQFAEEYVKDIVGLSVAATGGLAVDVDMGSVGIYSTLTDPESGQEDLVLENWVSFGYGRMVENTTAEIKPTEDTTVQPLRLELVTSGAGQALESGTEAAIAMRLGYLDNQGVAREFYCQDVRKYVTTSPLEAFATDSTTLVELQLRDPAELRWVEFVPHDDSPTVTASWHLQTLTASLGEGIQLANRNVSRWFLEQELGQPVEDNRVALAEIIVTFDAKSVAADGQASIPRRGSSAAGTMQAMELAVGDTLYVENIQVSKSDLGFTVTLLRGREDITHLATRTENSFTYTVTAQDGGKSLSLMLTSTELPEASVTLPLQVEAGLEISLQLQLMLDREGSFLEDKTLEAPRTYTVPKYARLGDQLMLGDLQLVGGQQGCSFLVTRGEADVTANLVEELGGYTYTVTEADQGQTLIFVIAAKEDPSKSIQVTLQVEAAPEAPEDSETTGGETTGGESTGGETTGGESTGGETTGGETTGGESTGGESTGGESTGGESTEDNGTLTPDDPENS